MLFNHSEIYEEIKSRFAEKGYDTEFGSNIQQIQNGMQYLVSMLNQNTQVNVRETILSSQTKRKMILEGQRMFGYEQIPKRSYQYSLDLRIKNETGQDSTFTLQNRQTFTSGGKTYWYMGDQISINVPRQSSSSDGTAELKDILVIEGDILRSQDHPELRHVIRFVPEGSKSVPERFMDIPFRGVEENGIFLSTKLTTPQGTQEDIWTKSDIFIDTEAQNLFVRQDNVNTGYPRIFFQYGNQGTGVQVGTEVSVDLLISSGSGGVQGQKFDIDYSDSTFEINITNFQEKIVGTDEESDKSIKDSQPLFNNTQNRIVTIHDYKSIQSRQGGQEDAQIWDGFEELEKLQGNIWFSFVPGTRQKNTEFSDDGVQNPTASSSKNTVWVLKDSLNEDYIFMKAHDWKDDDGSSINNPQTSDVSKIFSYMRKYSVPTLRFNYRQPIYLDFDVRINVQQYNQQQPQQEQNLSIFEQVRDYFTDVESGIEAFESKFFQSELTDAILERVVRDTNFDVQINTSVPLFDEQVNTDAQDEGFIVFRLGAEFKPITHNGYIQWENLPNIETKNFIDSLDLKMPQSQNSFSLVTSEFQEANTHEQDVKLSDGTTVGKYRIYGNARAIEVQLDKSKIGSFDGKRVNVTYPSQNISVFKNTFPRLNSVKIVQGQGYVDE